MLKFVILNGYQAGKDAGHKETMFDTTLAEDIEAARKEFNRLIGEGRTALTEDGTRVTEMPTDGEVTFLLQMVGG